MDTGFFRNWFFRYRFFRYRFFRYRFFSYRFLRYRFFRYRFFSYKFFRYWLFRYRFFRYRFFRYRFFQITGFLDTGFSDTGFSDTGFTEIGFFRYRFFRYRFLRYRFFRYRSFPIQVFEIHVLQIQVESDINTLFKDTDVLFSGMKQMQKQQNYLMQRDNNQARKEANMQAVVSNWPAQAQEQDRDRIIDWLVGNAQIPAREFQYASHKVQADSLSRISLLHFRSIWATRKFLDSARRVRIRKKPIALLANR